MATETMRWELVIDDKGAPKLKAMGQDLDGVGKASARAGRGFDALDKQIKDNDKAFARLKNSLGPAIAAVGTAAVAAFAGAAKAGLEFATRVDDLSQSLGISTDNMQILSQWADLSGTNLESLASATAKLEVKIASGDAELKRFGVTSLDAHQALLQVADAVQAAPTQMEKVRIANAAFGKSWRDMMPLLNQGSAELRNIADSTSIIDSDSIQRLADMDDEIVKMSNAFRSLAASITALAGPTVREAAEFWSGLFNDMAHPQESESDFMKRMGAVQERGSGRYKLTAATASTVGAASSDDLLRLMTIANDREGGRSVQDSYGALDNISSKYKAAKAREADRAAAAAKAQAEAAISAEEAAAAEERAAAAAKRRASEQDKLEEEMRALRSRYAEIIADADLGGRSAMAQAILGANPGEDMKALMMGAPGASGAYVDYMDATGATKQSMRESQDAAWQARGREKTDRYGRSALRTGDAGRLSTRDILDIGDMEKTEAKLKDLTKASQEWEDAWGRAADSFAGTFASSITNSLMDGKLSFEAFGEAGKNALASLAQEAIYVAAKMAVLYALTGGSATAGVSFASMLFGGHATGTVASPGGIGLLGEAGPERYRLPSGQEGIASAGLYAVPRGTQVWPAQTQQTSTVHQTFQIHVADAGQGAALIRRLARQEVESATLSNYRSRAG